MPYIEQKETKATVNKCDIQT